MRSPVILLLFLLVFNHFAVAQSGAVRDDGTREKGVLPFTGIRYVNSGIWGKEIQVTLDGSTWTGNRLPMDAEFKIKLEEPTGLKKDEEGKAYPGIEVLVLSTRGDTLGYAANIFGDESAGMDELYLKSLTLTMGYSEGVEPGDTLLQHIRFFDRKSPNELRLYFPIVIAQPDENFQTSSFTYGAKSWTGYDGKASGGIELKSIEVTTDTTEVPGLLTCNILVPELTGLSVDEARNGTYTFYLYDWELNDMSFSGIRKSFNISSPGGGLVNIRGSISYDPTNPLHDWYIVRLRWESKGGGKVLDIVNRRE